MSEAEQKQSVGHAKSAEVEVACVLLPTESAARRQVTPAFGLHKQVDEDDSSSNVSDVDRTSSADRHPSSYRDNGSDANDEKKNNAA